MFSHKKVMQDNRKNWRSVEINLNKSRHTISRMPGKRHRKSLYCRHREQLWGDKKGNWYYWNCWYLSLPVCLFVCMYFYMREKKKERKTEWERVLACRFINIHLPTNMRGSSLNKQERDWLSEKVKWKGCGVDGVNDGCFWLNSTHAGGAMLDFDLKGITLWQETICESNLLFLPFLGYSI